jgi:hypothetical protein
MHCAADFAFKRLQSDIENDAGLNFWNQCDLGPWTIPHGTNSKRLQQLRISHQAKYWRLVRNAF